MSLYLFKNQSFSFFFSGGIALVLSLVQLNTKDKAVFLVNHLFGHTEIIGMIRQVGTDFQTGYL